MYHAPGDQTEWEKTFKFVSFETQSTREVSCPLYNLYLNNIKTVIFLRSKKGTGREKIKKQGESQRFIRG